MLNVNDGACRVNGNLFSAFTRLIGCIEISDLSQAALDKCELGDSVFRGDRDCWKHLVSLREKLRRKKCKSLLVYGPSKREQETALLMIPPQFKQDKQIEMRFPYIWNRGIASLNGKVYFIGGSKPELCGDVLPIVMVADPQTGGLSEAPPLQTPRCKAAIATSANELFVCGGVGKFASLLSTCERFVEGNSTWSPLTPLKQARVLAAAIVLSEDDHILTNGTHLLLTGGFDEHSSTRHEVSLLSLGVGDSTWIDMAPMHHARYQHGIALFAERVLVVAGNACNTVEMFTFPRTIGDPGTWTDLAPVGGLFIWTHPTVQQGRLFAFEYHHNRYSQLEEFVADTPGQKDAGDRVDLKGFSWRPIGDCPDLLMWVEGVVSVDINLNPAI